MKTIKSIIYLTIIIISSISVYSQGINKWVEVDIPDRISQRSYLDVFFFPDDPSYGWICGFDSQVSFTTDGGVTWKTVKVDGNQNQLESIHFPTKDIGYTSGHVLSNQGMFAGIFKSTDGGNTWRNITPKVSQSIDFWGTYFYDENNGLIAANEGCGPIHIYKTTNGGDNWDIFTDSVPTGTKLSDIWVDGETGIGQAISSGFVWRSTDYGSTWDIEFTTGDIDWPEELSFSNNSFTIPIHKGCQGGSGNIGEIIFTPDRGNTLNVFTVPGNNPMYGSFTLSDSVGWACGLYKAIYKTEDAGNSWELVNCGVEGSLDDIYFINDTTAWVVGDYVYKSAIVPTGNVTVNIDTIDVCEGTEFVLQVDSTRDYKVYEWNTGDRTKSRIARGVEDFKIMAYDDSCSVKYFYEYHINYLPVIDPEIQIDESSSFCVGDTVILRADNNEVNIEWSTGELSDSILVTEPGTYYLMYNNENGCSTIDSVEIEFAQLPEPSINSIGDNNFCIGDSILLSSDKDYSNYLWLNSNGDTISIDKSIYVKQDDEYQLIVKNEFGCESMTSAFSVDVRNDTNQLYVKYHLDSAFVLDTNTLTQSICGTMKVYNISWSEHILYNISLRDKYYFSNPQSQFPHVIPPQDSIELEFCFRGDTIGNFSDLVTIEDLCSPHVFSIETYTEGFEMEGITRCEVDWRFRAIELSEDYVYESSSPYPNPSAGKISLDYMEFGNIEDGETKLYLYGSNGEYIDEFEKIVDELSHHSNGTLSKGKFILNVNVRQGVYFIQERHKNKTNVKPIVIMN
ncbi:MAG: WD40/YVTN/BNR-like repeat-containing protein [Chlorobiota bacterium]